MFGPLHRRYGHEDVFADRYDALVRAALRVTDGDRDAAEDLVQDAFIRFTLVQPPLDEVERLDAYLYVMLRNMHTSRVRRRARVAEVSLSILDFDSLDIGLDSIDAAERLEARQTLYAACHYGCLRRHSSKAGSIFLLRFFHGYLPSEIARIAGMSTAIVDELVFRARREVKVFVRHPEQLAFMRPNRAAGAAPLSIPTSDGDSEEAMVRVLRQMIFSERHEHCWSKEQLREMCSEDRSKAMTKEELAALVACPTCLDAVNTILNLPKLAHRWPTDTLGPGSRGGSGSGGSTVRLSSGRRRARAVFEHGPRQLRVLVNGYELGSHTIGSASNELVLTANVGEPVALVELFSEQGLCLLFLDACPPPDGSVRQRRRVDLSDGRHAELELTFSGPWPTVRATYDDPREAVVADHDEGADRVESTAAAPVPRVPKKPWLSGVFDLRPAPAGVLFGVLLVWLLFWTPGTEVSAAERIADTIKWLVSKLLDEPGETPAAPAPLIPPTSSLTPAPVEPIPSVRSNAPPIPSRLTSAQRTALELRTIAQLQRVDAYLGQEVSFGRVDSTRVNVRAAVDGDARRQALLSALGPLTREGVVHADIADLRSAATGASTQAIDAASTTRDFAFVKDQFPMFETLRRYVRHQHEFQGQASTTPVSTDERQIDADARRFAIRVLEHSRRASQHAWALKHLGDRFPHAAMRSATSDTQDVWQTVIREHARAYRQEMALFRSALEPVIKASGLLDEPATETRTAAMSPATDMWSRIERLLDLHRVQDSAIQAAFAIQAGESPSVNVVRTTTFWRLLDESDSVASEIAAGHSPQR